MSDEFNEPELKAAVKRAWESQSAPPGLRFRVNSAVAGSQSPEIDTAAPNRLEVKSSVRARSGGAFGFGFLQYFSMRDFAVAAGLLLFVAAFLLNDWRMSSQTAAVTHLPDATAAAFVTTHDGCCKVNDHHFVPPQFAHDMSATGQWLSEKAHVPVLAVGLEGGWRYCGAGPCPVAGNRSGHLLFKRGDQQLSLFSIPASELNVDPADHLYPVETLHDHQLAAFTRNGGLYCIVAHDPEHEFGLDQIESLRDSLVKDFPSDVYATVAGHAAPLPPLAVILND